MWTGNLKKMITAAGAALLSLALADAHAVPSFGRQTGLQCAACHTVPPELTSFGRQFKLRGFTLGNALDDKKFPFNLPVSAVVVPSVNSTKNTEGVEREIIPRDGKLSLQIAGVYYAGRIAGNFGALAQYNYEGIEHKSSIEMVDIRYADSTTVGKGKELIYGVTVNNNPTLSDIYNSTPMWSFPHLTTEHVIMPAASALVDMTLFRQVGGVGAYGFWNNLLYGELALYRTNKTGALRFLGAGVPTEIFVKDYAPYWRLALQREWASHTLVVGTFGMAADVFPDPNDLSTPTDRFRDVAFDAQYHYIVGDHILSAHSHWIREKQRWDASFPMGITSNPSDTLKTFRADVHYFYRRLYGGGIRYFSTRGDADQLKYNTGEPVMGSITGSPNTRSWEAEVNYLPLQNIKLGLRYTAYTKFNGARTNYDGFGRNAKDNNTVYLYAWILL